MRTLKLLRAWACYHLMSAFDLLPRSWQYRWPLDRIGMLLLRYGGWWALRQNPNLPDELKRAMRSKDGGGAHG